MLLIISFIFRPILFNSQIFNPIVELTILLLPIEIPTKKAEAEIEIYPLIVEITMSKCSV